MCVTFTWVKKQTVLVPSNCPSTLPSEYSLPCMNIPLFTHFPIGVSSWGLIRSILLGFCYTHPNLLHDVRGVRCSFTFLLGYRSQTRFLCNPGALSQMTRKEQRCGLASISLNPSPKHLGSGPTCPLVSFSSDKCSRNNGKACKCHRLHCE